MKIQEPTPELVAFLDDLKMTLGRHTNLDAMQMLAVASQFVGNLIALQDQRIVTADMAMDMVCRNIEIGNMAVIDGLTETDGSA